MKKTKLHQSKSGALSVFASFDFRRTAVALCGLAAVFAALSLRPADAAFEDKPSSARSAALGGGFAAVPNDANSVLLNPAALGGLSAAHFSFMQTALFNIPDLSYITAAGAFPTKSLGTLGFAFSQFGPAMYKETELALSHSFALARRTYFGYNLRNQSLNIQDFGSASSMGVDIGLHTALTDSLLAGFSAKNITNPTLGSTVELPAQVYRIGLAYYPADGLMFLLETSKDLVDDSLSYHGGAEINMAKQFVFRVGTRTNPSGMGAGFGVNLGIFRINYAMTTHPILESQHLFGLALKFGPEEEIVRAEAPRSRRAGRTARRAPSSRATQYEEVKNLKINPNTATAEELKEIPGVGALTAQRILDHRAQGVTYSSADDLMGVPRMTKRILERMRPYLVFDGSSQAPSKPPAPTPPAPRMGISPAPQKSSDDDDGPPEPDEEAAPAPPSPVPAKPEPVKTAPAALPPAPKVPPVPTPKPGIPAVAPAVVPALPSVPAPAPVAPSKPVEPSKAVAPAVPEKPAASVSDDMLDINTASAEELQVLGFTSTQAKNIVRYRSKSGAFSSVDDVLKVPGVDAKTLENARESITAR